MRRTVLVVATVTLAFGMVGVNAGPSAGRDRPFSTSDLIAMKLLPAPQQFDLCPGRRAVSSASSRSSASPVRAREIRGGGGRHELQHTEFGQDFAPDNEIAIAVDPLDPDHMLAGSNDYYYRFNNSTGARQALVPTGFFTSFDGGETWVDGQVPIRQRQRQPATRHRRSTRKHGVALMAQLENVGGQGGAFVVAGQRLGAAARPMAASPGASRSWCSRAAAPGIGPANNAVFCDKEYIAVDNNPDSPHYGRAYVTASSVPERSPGRYAESPIYLSLLRRRRSHVVDAARRSPARTPLSARTRRPGRHGECDEDQFSYPAVASDGDALRPLPERPERGRVGGAARPRQPGHGGEVDGRRRDLLGTGCRRPSSRTACRTCRSR